MKSGRLDRRITLEQATPVLDEAGDPVNEWAFAFKRWARWQPKGMTQTEAAGATTREISADFTIRNDRQARTIAPESFRILYDGRVYTINGVQEDGREGRHEFLLISASTRPDLRGTMARGDSDVPNTD